MGRRRNRRAASGSAGTALTTSGKPPKRKGSKLAWKMLGNAAGVGAALVTTKALDASWRAAVGRKPPNKPESPDLAQREALAWAATSGAAMALMKTYATRRAAGYWLKSTGTLPPGFLEEKKKKKKKGKLI